MNRNAKLSAVVAIVALAAGFVLGQDKYSDTSVNQLPIAPVSVATLDVATVFKKSQKFNAAMAPITAKTAPIRAKYEHIKKEEVLPPYKKVALSAETKLYAETYQRLDEIVTRICKARNIGLVIRANLDSADISDRSSLLQGVNKPVVHSAVPDLTDEVIAKLDR